MSRLTLPRNRIANIDDSQSSALGLDASHYLELCRSINVDFYSPISRENIIKEFLELMLNWKKETQFTSSVLQICMNVNYQQIIGMGEKALPFIFEDLKTNPGHWFWALKAITRVDPVSPEHRGNLVEMTKTWLIWWEENAFKYHL